MTEVCLELFLFDNALMSLLILRIAGLFTRVASRAWGVALACALSAAVSALAMVYPVFLSLPAKIALLALMTFLPFYIRSPKEALRCALCVLLSTFVLGGMAYALCGVLESSMVSGVLYAEGSLRAILVALALSTFLPRAIGTLARKKRLSGYDVSLRIVTEFGESQTKGRIDTGNLLYEAVSNLPVIVADTVSLRGSIPAEWAQGRWSEKPVAGMVLIPYKSVGGLGMLPALPAKEAYWRADGEWRACSPCIVALSSSRLAGDYGAIVNADCVADDAH